MSNQKFNLKYSMIGYRYPFFLSNANLTEAHYLYEICSPSLDDNCMPYLSLHKISEKTRSNDPAGNDSDIMSVILGSKKDISSTAASYLAENAFRKDNAVVDPNGLGFPLVRMQYGNNIQKSMIIFLRDSNRWKNYRYYPGRTVDLLWTPTTFILFDICGDSEKDSIWLEPKALYNTDDVFLTNPLPLDEVTYKKVIYQGKTKFSDITKDLRLFEWAAMGR